MRLPKGRRSQGQASRPLRVCVFVRVRVRVCVCVCVFLFNHIVY